MARTDAVVWQAKITAQRTLPQIDRLFPWDALRWLGQIPVFGVDHPLLPDVLRRIERSRLFTDHDALLRNRRQPITTPVSETPSPPTLSTMIARSRARPVRSNTGRSQLCRK